jgi:hypothetical protein
MSHYLYALLMGLIGVLFTYLDCQQQHKEYPQITYIKTFIGCATISILTSLFFCKYKIHTKINMNNVGGGLSRTIAQSRQQILTGNPSF